MQKFIPSYNGTLRSHLVEVPSCISACSGIRVFGRRIKSVVFSTDVSIIKNINGDAIIAVYPFTPQPIIAQAIISVSDIPVFVGVGGGRTNGPRSVRLAAYAEHQGAFGVVVNAPITDITISQIKEVVDIPVIATIVSTQMDVGKRLASGADILNVSGAAQTPEIVRQIRQQFPEVPIIATGGPTEETIMATIEAGANAITYTPLPTGSCLPRVCGSTGPDTRSKQKDQPEKCRYFPTAPQCESPRCAAVGGFAALRTYPLRVLREPHALRSKAVRGIRLDSRRALPPRAPPVPHGIFSSEDSS